MSAPSAPPTVVRVLTADDHLGFLAAARDLVGATPGFEVVGEAPSGEQAVALAEQVSPDLVLLDVYMPGIGGIEAARRIHAALPDAVIVLVTAEAVEDLPAEAWSCGIRAILPKQRLRRRAVARIWELARATPPGSLLTSIDC